MSGPLVGLRVVELAGLGPVPHAASVLSDLGADVIRVSRPAGRGPALAGVVPCSHRVVTADLRVPGDRDGVLSLVYCADVLLEGFRPGVAERLGVGPDVCCGRNRRLIYGRMTGWGQTGPLASSAGHDINYLALTGFLHAIGDADSLPAPPLNLVGDFGGGSMLLLVGVLAALWERASSGLGQVVDAAIVDGIGLIGQMVWALRGAGVWRDERGANLLDGAAPFYRTYACADGKFVAVGALEPQFYAALLDGLGLSAGELPSRDDRSAWPELIDRFAEVFAGRTRDEWVSIFAGTDACVTPVLRFDEVPSHPHHAARNSFVDRDGVVSPAPAPRFSRTVADGAAPVEASIGGIIAEWSHDRTGQS